MKERPILFSGPMVRALLDGSKTQTRRVVKFPHQNPLGTWEPTSIGGLHGGRLADGGMVPEQGAIWHTRTGYCLACAYGQPGDRLWVREAFGSQVRSYRGGTGRYTVYRATDADAIDYETACGQKIPVKWKPSIHMPRALSRITLEIVSVRVERLQDISEADSLAEGVVPLNDPGAIFAPAKSAYCDLWESINGPSSWFLNPWVWVVEFTRHNAEVKGDTQ